MKIKANKIQIVSIFIFLLFLYMTFKTPLAGDDWGYALNGMSNNPFEMAINFYNGWSGRFFSELWGFLVAPNRWAWIIINPLLFVGIFIFICKIANKDQKIIGIILTICGMLFLSQDLRMETYTWIMGTTYVIPLFLSLVYFKLAFDRIEHNLSVAQEIIASVCLIVIGLMMENIAAVMILGEIILIIYCVISKKKNIKFLIKDLLLSIIAFTIMRVSPGSQYRLITDHLEWSQLSLWKKFASSYDNFLFETFINNKPTIFLFSITLILLMTFAKKEVNIVFRIISILINVLCIFALCSNHIIADNNFFIEPSSWFCFFFWPIFIINSFATIFIGCRDNLKSLFFLLLAGASAFAMCFSPIYGARSSLYLVYFVIVVMNLVINEIDIKKIEPLLCALFLVISITKSSEYLYKYHLVGEAQKERLSIIKYYQQHPEDKEVWIYRFPIYTVHAADIEDDDVYHLETFRDYYKLPQDYKNIHFGFKD